MKILRLFISLFIAGILALAITIVMRIDNIGQLLSYTFIAITFIVSFLTIYSPRARIYIWAYILIYLALNATFIWNNVSLIFYRHEIYHFIVMALLTGFCTYLVQILIGLFMPPRRKPDTGKQSGGTG